MSARELFRQWGVSERCYQEFLRCGAALVAHCSTVDYSDTRAGAKQHRSRWHLCMCGGCAVWTLLWLCGILYRTLLSWNVLCARKAAESRSVLVLCRE